jgi:hypothetical protein
MAQQFANVSCKYGAPMGRSADANLDDSPNSVRLFRVNLDSGGYDDGGAYWGTGCRLYCAIDADGARQFVRAMTRERAAFVLGVSDRALKAKLHRHGLEYGQALIDGRAPMPMVQRGSWGEVQGTREHAMEWMRESGHYHDGTPKGE